MRRLRLALARLLLVLLGLLLALGVVELVARHRVGTENAWMLINTPNWYDNGIFQPDRELMQVLAPGSVGRFSTPEFRTTVRISAQGLRGEELPTKAPGERRVLCVGDSFTLAVQVDEERSFQAALSQALTPALGPEVRVLNAGVDGYGTGQAARYAARLAPLVQPDALLLTFFLGNDFADNQGFRPGSYPTQRANLPSLLSPADRRWGWSAIYLHLRAWQKSRDPSLAPALGHQRAQVGLFARGADLNPVLGPTREALAELERTAQALGLPLVIAIAPPAYALDEARTASALAMVGLPGAADPEGPARALRALLPRSARVLDLRPALVEAEKGGRTYFIFDGHWTPRGHEAVGRALAPLLAEALGPATGAPRAGG